MRDPQTASRHRSTANDSSSPNRLKVPTLKVDTLRKRMNGSVSKNHNQTLVVVSPR